MSGAAADVSRTAPYRHFLELVGEAQRNGALIAGDIGDVGPLLWVVLHGLALSDHLVADRICETGYDADDMRRILALALRNLAPR